LHNLLGDLQAYGVDLVCSDQQIDTNTSSGKLLFAVLGAVSEIELDLIRERTKDGLERARSQGKRLGRPPKPEMTNEILQLRAKGLSLRRIGTEVGMSHQAVKQRLRRARVQKRVGNQDESS
jgi:DNA invertase Pin-like site-specific DNA recombinase